MHQAENKEIWYNCEFCGRRFKSGKERTGSKLCRNCIELRRLIRTWAKDGVWVKEAEELQLEQSEGGTNSESKRVYMNLTPELFAKELPKWYQKWRKNNPNYPSLEQRLTQKAHTVGYLEITDLVDITGVLSNPFNIANRVRKANTEDEIKEKTGEAIQHLSNPERTITDMMSISRWGRTYASKTLRCICPSNYGALDSKLIHGIDASYLPSKNEVARYCQFLDLCRKIQQMVSVPGPRENAAWFLADIEIALFQFVWDKNRMV